MATATSWHMRGNIMEACSCTTTCPCNFGSDPTEVPCGAIVGWRIWECQYGNTRPDGLNVVLYLKTLKYCAEISWASHETPG